jgi:hypothetical protein
MAQEVVTGTVSRVGNKLTSFQIIEIDDKWFQVYSSDQLNSAAVGDNISFLYAAEEKNGRVWNNVKGKLTVKGKTAPPTADRMTPYLPRERLILRQNALTNAVQFMVSNPNSDATVKAVLKTASEFEAWTSGDSDVREAKKKLSDEDPTEEDWKEAAGKLKVAS